jgi:hypothetical protein
MGRGLRLTEQEIARLGARYKALAQATTAHSAKPSRSKYNNVKTTTEDGTSDSQLEAKRAAHLKMLERAGHITGLSRQVRFRLMATGVVGVQHFETYVADFVYFDIHHRRFVVEDTKGYRTRDYQRKKRLMRELYGLEIVES